MVLVQDDNDDQKAGEAGMEYHMSFASYGDLASLCWIQNAHLPESLRGSLAKVEVVYGRFYVTQPSKAFDKSCQTVSSDAGVEISIASSAVAVKMRDFEGMPSHFSSSTNGTLFLAV